MTWFKSSYSNDDGGNCVEVAAPPGAILVRDSKLGSTAGHPRISIPLVAWTAFTAELRGSGLERPF